MLMNRGPGPQPCTMLEKLITECTRSGVRKVATPCYPGLINSNVVALRFGYFNPLTPPAHDLIVVNARWKGYRNIELVSMTAKQISTVLLRFDGKAYAEDKSTL